MSPIPSPLGDAVYRFDAFQVDARRGVLQREDGTEVRLRPRSYELLLLLLRHPQELLTREALLDALWPGLAVTDDSLTQCIGELRQAFGPRGAAVLRTLPRRGYMLAVPVRTEIEAPSPAPVPRAHGPAATADGQGRDVLFLASVEPGTGDAEEVAFARALGAALLVGLTTYEILHVLVPPAMPPEGAFLLTPALLGAGAGAVLSLRLEAAGTGEVFWAEQAALPSEGAWPETVRTLLGQVSLAVNAETLARARRRPLEALGARELIVLGREAHQRGGEANTREAQGYFRRALAVAPDAGVAHGYLALTMLRGVTHGWGDRDWTAEREAALQTAQRAVALGPRSGLCLAALSFALLQLGQWDEAVETARQSLQVSAVVAIDTRTVCAEVLAAAGEGEAAVAALAPSVAFNPFCPPRSRAVLGRALLMAGRTEAALGELHRAVALLPDYAPCLRSVVVAAVELGRLEEARAALARLERLQPNWVLAGQQALGFFRKAEDRERFLGAFARCGERSRV